MSLGSAGLKRDLCPVERKRNSALKSFLRPGPHGLDRGGGHEGLGSEKEGGILLLKGQRFLTKIKEVLKKKEVSAIPLKKFPGNGEGHHTEY